MKKIDAQDISIRYYENDYLYNINVNNDLIEIKRSILTRDYELSEKIIIKKNNILVNKILLNNTKTEKIKLTKEEEITLIKELFNSINKNNLVTDILDTNCIFKIIKVKYLNILIENENIGLSSFNYNDLIKNNKFELDIINSTTKDIIGNIIVDNNDLFIDINEYYLKESLILFHKLICIYRKDKNDYNIKVLKLDRNIV